MSVYVYMCVYNFDHEPLGLERDNVVYWKEPKGRSRMISYTGPRLNSCQGWHCIDWLFVEISFFRLCQGEPVCATCTALHKLLTLGTVLSFTGQLAQSFVTERAGGTTSLRRAGQHHISLRVACGMFNSASCSQTHRCKHTSELLNRQ